MNFEGYYLDGEDAYSPRDPLYQAYKVEGLEAKAKRTENRTMTQLTSRFQIKLVPFLADAAVAAAAAAAAAAACCG